MSHATSPQATPEADHESDAPIDRLDQLGESLARTRAEAISARQTSGIEEIWAEDEAYYEGIDELNQHEERTLWRQKPPGQAPARTEQDKNRSRVFPNITGPFTDAAAARMADMLLPTDDRSWALKPTTLPDLVGVAKGKYPQKLLQEMQAAHPDESELAAAMGKAKVEAKQVVDAAKEKADLAQKRIEDWHVECQWHAEVRAVIEDSAKGGSGVLKGPIPGVKKRIAYMDGGLQIAEELKPTSKRIDYWNFFPDGACGEDIHNGGYTWERDYITKKQLRELIGQPEYIESQIMKCLNEGPQQATAEYREQPMPLTDPEYKGKYEIWYFHGTAEREDLEAAGCECPDTDEEGNLLDPHVPAMVTMVNNRVIKAAMNPLDTGDFPYDVMVWRKRVGYWAGIGVARQIRTPQKIVTGGTRNLMDNAGLAGGPIIVFRQGVVQPADGVAGIGPRKVYYIKEDAEEMADATKAIGSVKVDMLVNEMMQIIELGMRLAEYVTGLPMLLQGQQGNAPDTVGGMTLLQNNASAVARRLARTFDDRVTEPHVRRYYVWLLQYGEDEEKGDFSIDARGSSALVERDIQNQELAQLGGLVLDPRFGKDPKRWMDEYLKSRHFDPKRFDYEDEEWQQIVENLAKKPQDNAVAVAQIRAETEQFKKQMDEKLKAAEMQFEGEQNDLDRRLDIVVRGLDAEIEQMKLGGQREIGIDKIKAMLADSVMKLRTQTKLAGMKASADLMAEPPTEPTGRAPSGESYQK